MLNVRLYLKCPALSTFITWPVDSRKIQNLRRVVIYFSVELNANSYGLC